MTAGPTTTVTSGPATTGPASGGRVPRRVLVPFGTRPEIIKLAPVVHALRAAGHGVTTVDTGQHADPAMAGDVQRELGLRPDVRLRLPDGPARVGALMNGATEAVAGYRPEVVLALGDTHTVPAYALAARAAGVPFAHLEAGLRSYNDRSIEEVNRRVAAVAAQLHFAPTPRAAAFLAAEGIDQERVFVVGNPVVDALLARRAEPVPVDRREGVLVTAHRASNVDDPERLARLVRLVGELASEVGPVLFPVHPRTAGRLDEYGLAGTLAGCPGVTRREPLPYDELLHALAAARIVVTDSGGLQEEAAYFGVPVVVLRRSTPRWEGVELGSTVLTGLTTDGEAAWALAAAHRLTRPHELARIAALPCPYGDGHTGERVAAILAEPATTHLLDLTEPDFTGDALPWTPTG